MKTTAMNIGVETVSVTPWGVIVVGNKEFADWTRGGIRLSKMTKADGNQVFLFAQGEGPVAVPSGKTYRWTRAWSAIMQRGPLRDFMATKPVEVRLTDGLKLEIELPPIERCKKYIPRKPRMDTPDQPINAVMPAHTPRVERPAVILNAQESAQDQVLHDLRDAAKTLNACRELIGDLCEFKVTDEGKLRVFVGYE